MAPFLPIRAFNRSQRIRIGRQTILPTVTSYVDVGDGQTRKELSNHTTLGAIFAVGGLTSSNAQYVVDNGGIVTNGTGVSVNVSAGEIRDRSTGLWVNGAAATNFALAAADGTLDRTSLVHWDAVSGAVGKTDGVLAAAGTSVAPATPAGKVPLYTVLVPAAGAAPTTKTDVRPRP